MTSDEARPRLSPGGVALPPWDLCGFDRDHDSHSLLREVNARDGEWRELAFMPYHAAWPLVEAWKGGEHLERAGVRSDRPVPEYLAVAAALKREREQRVR